MKNAKTDRAQRVTRTQEVEIKARPGEIFPLACPVEELKWIDNWKYDMVYSKSGINEENCIFWEDFSGPVLFDANVTTTWITSLYEPENGRINFVLITGDRSVINFKFDVFDSGNGVSTCRFDFVFTLLKEEKEREADSIVEEKLGIILNFLGDSLKHYCETGEILRG